MRQWAAGTSPAFSAWTTGFPITIDNGFTWATNWNIEGDAEPNGPAPRASNPKNVVVNGVSGPDIFADPVAAEAAFRPEWPGESGVRNNVIGDGMFNIDTGVAKDFSLGEQRRLEFKWEAFNATNSVRYDVRGPVGSSANLRSRKTHHSSADMSELSPRLGSCNSLCGLRSEVVALRLGLTRERMHSASLRAGLTLRCGSGCGVGPGYEYQGGDHDSEEDPKRFEVASPV